MVDKFYFCNNITLNHLHGEALLGGEWKGDLQLVVGGLCVNLHMLLAAYIGTIL